MNRTLLLTTAALAMGGFVSAGPALAQTTSPNSTTANSTNSSSAQQLVNDATQTVQEIKADSRFDTMLKQSKGVFIMPDAVQGAFIVGGKGAQGVPAQAQQRRFLERSRIPVDRLGFSGRAGWAGKPDQPR